MPTTSSYNPRTVLTAMFNAGEAKTQFFGHVYGNYNNPAIQTSDGNMSTSQGVDAIFNGTLAWPFYVNATIKNLTTIRRHPNQVSHVFYFNKANGCMFASQRFQETWTGAPNTWVMNDANFTGLAWPDQTLSFDSASPGAVLYTSPDYAYKNVAGQRYPGNIARYFDPTRRGGTPPSIGNVKDKIVMTIRNGEMQNEFVLRYDVYSASVSSGNVIAYTWQFYVDALNQRFNRIIMRDAVVTAIDAVTGLVTKRTDNIDAKRAVVAERAMPSSTVLTYNTTGAPAHAANLIGTVSSSLTVPNDGQVRFYEGTTLLGTSNVNTSGVATLAYTWPSAGTRSITAKYSGDGDSWTASTSAAVVVSVT